MNAVLADIMEVQKDDPFAKFVIFSQHSESLKAMERQFKSLTTQLASAPEPRPGYQTALVDLSKSGGAKATEEALNRFNGDPECNVCLLTMGASAAGLTLTQAKTCYILEPTHNAAEEAQALSRVHRIGQQQCVRCVIFYAKNTCEERILALRKKQDSLTAMHSNVNALFETADAEAAEMKKESKRKGKKKRKGKRKKGGRARDDEEEDEEEDEYEDEDEDEDKDKDKDEDEDEEGVVTNKDRRVNRANARATASVAQLAGNFFSAGQMTILFGASQERSERKNGERNQAAIAFDQRLQQQRARQPERPAVPARPVPPPRPEPRAFSGFNRYFAAGFLPTAVEISDSSDDSYVPRGGYTHADY
jgi:hypothetical protein